MRTIEEMSQEGLEVENNIGPIGMEDIMVANSRDRTVLLTKGRKEEYMNNQEVMIIAKTISPSNIQEKNKNTILNTPKMRKSRTLESASFREFSLKEKKL
jgi:hypothetical protein